jgi:hypothetical protein
MKYTRTVTTHAYHFLSGFLRSPTGHTARPILTRNGSFNAVPRYEIPLGSQHFNKFLRGSVYLKPKKFRHYFASHAPVCKLRNGHTYTKKCYGVLVGNPTQKINSTWFQTSHVTGIAEKQSFPFPVIGQQSVPQSKKSLSSKRL